MQWEAIDYAGLLGGVVLLFAFWRTSTGTWKTTSAWYEFDNFIAAILLIFYTWQKHAYVNILLNIVWGIVAFRGLSSYAERRIRKSPDFRRGYRKGKRMRRIVTKS